MDNHQEYRLQIVSKKTDATDSIKAYIEKKLGKLEKITSNIIDMHVKVEVQKLDHSVHMVMKFSHFSVQAHAVTHDLYQSVDRSIEKLQKKLRKWKTKIQHHHAAKPAIEQMPQDVFENTENYLLSINDMIKMKLLMKWRNYLPRLKFYAVKTLFKTLTMDEALMKMELSADNFMLFRGEEDQKLKVVYRRRDQSYGLLQPEQ